MTAIHGPLEIRKRQGSRWELMSEPMYWLNNGRVYRPRRGFILDFGSIPRPFWSLLGLTPIGSEGDEAWLLHDWMYYLSRDGAVDFTRKDADDAMLEVLLYRGVDDLVAYGVYTAVRAAAGGAWGKTPPAEDPGEDFSWFYE